jgi:predicted GH43/DUF377 family glycosyl hydrolase
MVEVVRTEHHLRNDPERLVLRPFIPGSANFGGDLNRVDRMVRRILELPHHEVTALLADLRVRHESRFPDLEGRWLEHFELAGQLSDEAVRVSDADRQLIIGATLSQAYAYEGTALTNPCIVPLGAVEGDLQPFLMSARAIGEGHISSIVFITGSVDGEGTVALDRRHSPGSNGARTAPTYSRAAFRDKLVELGFLTDEARTALKLLPETFSATELSTAMSRLKDADVDQLAAQEAIRRMHWLADSNYELSFPEDLPLSGHVISPAAPAESQGIEDARFVRFTDDDGSVTYYATYTAYDGLSILPQLIETPDFHNFRMATMTGPAVHHKGMAIFPRRIRGEFVALSRHDHERSYVLRSDEIRRWNNAELVFKPEHQWDLVQIGNCGSPIETEHGWLVITHGVGPMRRYVLGAVLLDLDEPSKVVGRLHTPFLEPEDGEEYGYVPDVVYSCGSMVHGVYLVTPFGYADVGIKVAVTRLDDLIAEMS